MPRVVEVSQHRHWMTSPILFGVPPDGTLRVPPGMRTQIDPVAPVTGRSCTIRASCSPGARAIDSLVERRRLPTLSSAAWTSSLWEGFFSRRDVAVHLLSSRGTVVAAFPVRRERGFARKLVGLQNPHVPCWVPAAGRQHPRLAALLLDRMLDRCDCLELRRLPLDGPLARALRLEASFRELPLTELEHPAGEVSVPLAGPWPDVRARRCRATCAATAATRPSWRRWARWSSSWSKGGPRWAPRSTPASSSRPAAGRGPGQPHPLRARRAPVLQAAGRAGGGPGQAGALPAQARGPGHRLRIRPAQRRAHRLPEDRLRRVARPLLARHGPAHDDPAPLDRAGRGQLVPPGRASPWKDRWVSQHERMGTLRVYADRARARLAHWAGPLLRGIKRVPGARRTVGLLRAGLARVRGGCDTDFVHGSRARDPSDVHVPRARARARLTCTGSVERARLTSTCTSTAHVHGIRRTCTSHVLVHVHVHEHGSRARDPSKRARLTCSCTCTKTCTKSVKRVRLTCSCTCTKTCTKTCSCTCTKTCTKSVKRVRARAPPAVSPPAAGSPPTAGQPAAQVARRQPEPRAQGRGEHLQGGQIRLLEGQVALVVGVARHQIVDLDARGRRGLHGLQVQQQPGRQGRADLGVDARQVVVEPPARLQQVADRQPARPPARSPTSQAAPLVR